MDPMAPSHHFDRRDLDLRDGISSSESVDTATELTSLAIGARNILSQVHIQSISPASSMPVSSRLVSSHRCRILNLTHKLSEHTRVGMVRNNGDG